MNRRIRNVALTLALLLAAGGGAAWLAVRFPLGHRTECPAAASAGLAELRQGLGLDLTGADRAVIQSGFTGKRAEIRGEAKMARLLAFFDGTNPRLRSVSEPMSGYTLWVTFYRSEQSLGGFDFGSDAIVKRNPETTAIYSLDRKLDVGRIAETYGLGELPA